MQIRDYDRIEEYQGCIIQHGHYNDRIYLMEIISADADKLPWDLIALAKKEAYSKIFVKIPESMAGNFLQAGFKAEARIPAFYAGAETVVFMGYYLNDERLREDAVKQLDDILTVAQKQKITLPNCPADCSLRVCNESDIYSMSKIYRRVFSSYPFPIYNIDYLRQTMQSNVDYFCIKSQNDLVAVSSAEVDRKSSSAEMTDFAVLPEWRGHNFALNLLLYMEDKMSKKGINTVYTIARAISFGMNITFSRAGYTFGGRLKNNTNIAGSIESMNVWYKILD